MPTPIEEARKHFDRGRGEQALALLERTAKENPEDQAVRAEYFRLRALVIAQWLAQAETLRTAGQAEAAEARRRLAFEELFLYQASLAQRRRRRREGRPARALPPAGEMPSRWLRSPFMVRTSR